MNFFSIRHNGHTVACETLFAYVAAPSDGVTLVDGIVEYLHQLVDRQVVGRSPAPVVLDFQNERLVERVVSIGSE